MSAFHPEQTLGLLRDARAGHAGIGNSPLLDQKIAQPSFHSGFPARALTLFAREDEHVRSRLPGGATGFRQCPAVAR